MKIQPSTTPLWESMQQSASEASTTHLWESVQQSMPEASILLVILSSLCVDMLIPREKKAQLLKIIGICGAVVAIAALWGGGMPRLSVSFFGHFAQSPGLQYAKTLILLAYLFSLLFFEREESPTARGLYEILFASLVLGTLLIVAANSFLALYLSLTLSGVATYLLCSCGKASQSQRVALKYLLFGMLGTGAWLYGFSLLYALNGELDLHFTEQLNLLGEEMSRYQIIICVLICLGFSFKLGAFPMHFWVPGVYSSMPISALAYLSTATKIAIWVLLYRLFSLWWSHPVYGQVWALLAVMSFLWGNLAALSQYNPRRLLGYSSVAYAGLFLLPMAAGVRTQLPLLFGSTVYLLSQYVAFVSLSGLEKRGIRHMSEYASCTRKEKIEWGVPLICAFIALSGLPPLAGFTTKFLILSSVMSVSDRLFWVLCGLVLLSSVWALFYYVRPLYLFFLKPSPRPSLREEEGAALTNISWKQAVMYLFILLLLFFFAYPMPMFALLEACTF